MKESVKRSRKIRIKDFNIMGEALDGETIIGIRREVEDRLIDQMRGKGYVPIIDLLPQLFWEYDKDSENFKFEIVVYGTYVGKVKSRKIMGVLDSRPIMFETTSPQDTDL